MRSKNKKRGLMLLGSSLLLGIIYFNSPLYGMDFVSNTEVISKPQDQTENFGADNTETVVQMTEIAGETISVRAWHNEEDNRYYFFLPEYMERGIVPEKETEAEYIFLSDIPTVYIKLETGTFDAVKESKEVREKISLSLFTDEGGAEERQLAGTIKARGNASFHAPRYKKSYTVKLEEDVGLLDMPAGREWVLLAHYYDDTHLREYLTFDMARRLEMAYVPAGELVNLYVDGEYEGIYFLGEKIGISPEKINITDLESLTLEKMPQSALKKYPYAREGVRGGQDVIIEKGYVAHEGFQDITGGYLLELEWLKDRYNEEKSGFTSDANQCVVIKSPEYATGTQVAYIKNYYQQFEDALRKSRENHTEEYLEYIDLDSFVKKYLVEEVSKNMDANMSSQYLYKDKDTIDGKLYAGPVWDYDRAYDNKVGDVNNRGADMFWVNQGSAGFPFWKNLYETPVFEKRVRELYRYKLSEALREYADEKLPEWENEIHDSVIADMFRYQSEYEEKMDGEARLSREMQALTEFIRERKAFLDREWITN